MSSEPEENFKDNALKSAVVRAWGSERAPDALRRRVAGLVAASRPSPAARGLNRSSMLFKIAAALLLTSGIALLAYRMTRPEKLPPYVPVVATIPDALARAFTAAHDRAIHLKTFDASLPQADDASLAAAVQTKLAMPPLVSPIGRGFQFVGALMTPISDAQAAELVYQRENHFISVFTVPMTVAPTTSCEATLEGGMPDHPMAGFSHGRAMYTIVGSSADGSLTAAEVTAIRNTLRRSIPGAAVP